MANILQGIFSNVFSLELIDKGLCVSTCFKLFKPKYHDMSACVFIKQIQFVCMLKLQ